VKDATKAGEENIEKTSKSAEQVINEIKEDGLAKYKVIQEEADAAAEKLKSDYESAKEKTAQRLAAIERGINVAIGKTSAEEIPKGPA
jgi:vacuolar-type H+-ATPase subunit E/Vma4